MKYQVWNTGLCIPNELKVRAGATDLSAWSPYIAKADTVRVCTRARAAITRNKVRRGAALLAKGRRGGGKRAEGRGKTGEGSGEARRGGARLDTDSVTTVLAEQF